jgi:site-specific DNA recombinase
MGLALLLSPTFQTISQKTAVLDGRLWVGTAKWLFAPFQGRSVPFDRLKRRQAEYKRLDDRIHAMYVDKLDGLVDTAFFEKMSNHWREEQARCQREIERHQSADKSYLSEGVGLLELARDAQRLFATQEPREKRRLLNFLLSNSTWDDGKVVATFRQPFDMLAETIVETRSENAPGSASERVFEKWLPEQDSNLRPFD